MNDIPRRASMLAGSAALLSLGVAILAPPADAVSTRQFVLDSSDALAAGELDGTAVLSDGSVTLGVSTRRIGLDDAASAWCFARGNGAVFIGTGNDGKIFQLRGDAVSEFAETGQLAVTSLVFAGGDLYAGTLPEGRIYKIDAQGQVQELTRPDGVEHVWELVYHDGTLFAATGPEGKVFAIDRTGNAQVYWDSEAGHVMTLALADDGTLYAGTSDEALVVHLRGPGRAEVVYDFPGNEVTAIAVQGGVLAVAANEFPNPPSGTQHQDEDDAAAARGGRGPARDGSIAWGATGAPSASSPTTTATSLRSRSPTTAPSTRAWARRAASIG